MKYPIALVVVAALMLLVGLGIRMHADWRYTNKLYYHTVESTLYQFENVFAERKIGDTVQLFSIIAGIAGAIWLCVVKVSRDQSKRP